MAHVDLIYIFIRYIILIVSHENFQKREPEKEKQYLHSIGHTIVKTYVKTDSYLAEKGYCLYSKCFRCHSKTKQNKRIGKRVLFAVGLNLLMFAISNSICVPFMLFFFVDPSDSNMPTLEHFTT